VLNRYDWSVDLQEAYASPEIVLQRLQAKGEVSR